MPPSRPLSLSRVRARTHSLSLSLSLSPARERVPAAQHHLGIVFSEANDATDTIAPCCSDRVHRDATQDEFFKVTRCWYTFSIKNSFEKELDHFLVLHDNLFVLKFVP